MSEQYVETVIIGAGPVGLFQIFELGLLGISTHIIDSLGSPGGQCTELYPDKPIYDIPALPICGAQELIDRLLEQAKPFNATFHLGQEVTELRVLEDGKFHVATSTGTRLIAGAVVIAGGVGSFQPRRLSVPGIEQFEGSNVHYRVRSAGDFFEQDLVICGGGDSALDWTVAFCDKARSLTLVHRRAEFRAAPATVARMRDLVARGQDAACCRATPSPCNGQWTIDRARRADAPTGNATSGAGGSCVCFLRPAPEAGSDCRMGPGAREEGAQGRYREDFRPACPESLPSATSTSIPGKKKLILSGFHEAALAAFAIQHHLYPEKRQFLQYTTTSPIMQKRLGVGAAEAGSA